MRLAVTAAASFIALGSSVVFALTEMECADLFRKADSNGDGVVLDAEALRYLAAMRVWTVPVPADGKLDYAGIWRGTASMEGKAFSLAVDFKGNVVSAPR